MSNTQETELEKKKRLKKVATATIVGSMLEWYDFYLYATMASIVFAKVFFDTSDPGSASLKAFATFAIGFIAPFAWRYPTIVLHTPGVSARSGG